MNTKIIIPTLLLAFSASAAMAVVVKPTSYDMPNGEEYTSYSGYEYFDEKYDGNGDKTVSRAQLSGGKGDLTDGIIGTATWKPTDFFTTPQERDALQAGIRPYVGWFVEESKGAPYQVDIVFHFDKVVQIDQVDIHGLMGNLNRSSNNEPTMPDYFRISTANGSAQIDRSNTPHATRTYLESIQTGGLTGNQFTLSVGFNYDTTDWFSGRDFIFLSEVEFKSTAISEVPLPPSALLFLGSLGLTALARRKSKS